MVAMCMAFTGLLLIIPTVRAQTSVNFAPETPFQIADYSGTIHFAVDGTYARATLENNAWTFHDLRLVNSTALEFLKASVQDCNITIRSFSRFLSVQSAGILRYNATGPGTQIFNFGLSPKNREWSVIFDGEFLPRGKGWQIADDGTITITGATTDVIIFYLDYPQDIDNSSLPFHLQHSVAIITGALVAGVAIAAVVISTRNRKTNRRKTIDELGKL